MARAGVWNIVLGALAVIAGASGKFVLPFTQSSTPLIVVGGLIAAFGVSQLLRSRRA